MLNISSPRLDVKAADTLASALRPGRSTAATSLAALSARFRRDDAGSVAIMFGLMVVPCIMLTGMAVDFGRVLSVRQQAQGILDNAALAGGRAAQTAGNNYGVAAQTAANNFFAAQKVAHTLQSTISNVATNAGQTQFEWTATSWVATPFMSVAEMLSKKSAPVGAPGVCATNGWSCQQVTVKAAALLKAGGNNNDTNIETSLMLDVTGSMAGQKFTDMKAAAKDLIEIVVWNDQSVVKSRVAIAPFADGINVGTVLAPLVRGTVTAGTNPIVDDIGIGYQNFKFTKVSSSKTSTYALSKSCVSERVGNDRWTDAAPSTATTRVGRAYLEIDGSCSMVDPNGDTEVNLVTPLTNDKVVLNRRIDKLKLAGSTAGQLGTAWAWYLLSPNWSYLFPTTSQPGPYNDTKVKKIAVLMTDGDYNTEFWKGVKAKGSYDERANGSPTNGTAESQAAELCKSIKAKNIELYTVGFQVSSTARTLLKACATDAAHYYDATSGDALKTAFRDIALKISTLRLSQ